MYHWTEIVLLLAIASHSACALSIRDHLSIDKGFEHLEPTASIRNVINYVSSRRESDLEESRFTLEEHSHFALKDILSFSPKAPKQWFEEQSILEWILNQEIIDEDNMLFSNGYSFPSDIDFASDTEVTSPLPLNETTECQDDLDALLGAIYEFFDPKFSGYTEVQILSLFGLCSKKFKKILNDKPPKEKSFPPWGWKFVDVMAKPPTAILGGQLQWVGGYEMCNKISVTYAPDKHLENDTRSFGGRYCRVMIGSREGANFSLPLSLGFGLCLPDTCTTDGVMDHLKANPGLIDRVLGAVGFEVKSAFCGNDLDYSSDSRAQLAFGIIIMLLTIVICATLYDLIIRPLFIGKFTLQDDVQIMKPVNSTSDIQAMSVYPDLSSLNGNVANGHAGGMNGHIPRSMDRQASMASTKSLLSDATSVEAGASLGAKPGILDQFEAAFVGFSGAASLRKIFDVINLGPDHMPSLDGIRFLSIVYAVGGNTCLFGILYTESMTTSNLVDKLLELPNQFAFQPIINYPFCTDSFLVVSGTVISYHWLRRLRKARDHLTVYQVVHYYCHRYWTLMPVMMFTIMTYTCLYKYLLSGPISPPEITDAENCRTNWWANLLMVGNLANTGSSCLAWTWYIPMMFQLHIVAPIILIPLSYKRWAGWLSLGLMYVIFLGTVSGVVRNNIYGDAAAWYYDYIQTPWCRAGPFFIGIGVGILLHDRILHGIPKNCLTKLVAVALWLVSVGTLLMCVFISYTKYRKEDPIKWSKDQTISFHVFARSAWGLAIAYMILACETGFGGMMKSILGHRCFIPPSRMALPVLVFHAIFIFKFAYSQHDTIYVNFNNLLYIFFGHLILIFLVGIMASILFHLPFQGLEEAFIGAKTKLDIILAGSCPQSFRELKDKTERIKEDEYELKSPEATQGVTFM